MYPSVESVSVENNSLLKEKRWREITLTTFASLESSRVGIHLEDGTICWVRKV